MTATILVVEDDPDTIVLIRTMVKRAGHKVLTAADGAGGFATARRWIPDLILINVSLAGAITGLDVCRAVRATPDLAHIPVVMLSGWAFDSDIQAGQEAGADAYFAKPFDRAELTVTIQGLLARVTAEVN